MSDLLELQRAEFVPSLEQRLAELKRSADEVGVRALYLGVQQLFTETVEGYRATVNRLNESITKLESREDQQHIIEALEQGNTYLSTVTRGFNRIIETLESLKDNVELEREVLIMLKEKL